MRRSKHTLIGRIHEQARLEAQHDVEALYEFIDPVIRARREQQRDDEPELTLSDIRAFVKAVRTAEVEEVEILEARKVSKRHSARPAALVRSIVRYNDKLTANESRTIWVRDHGVWYSTALNKRWWPAA
jgi:hypothetical protein